MVQLYSSGDFMCPPMSANWRHLANTIELVLLRPTRVHNANDKSIGSAVFAQLTAESHYTLQWAPLSLKIAPSHRDLNPHLIHGSLGPPVLNPNGILIASAVFAGLNDGWLVTRPTDRPTDHATRSVTVGRIYARSIALFVARLWLLTLQEHAVVTFGVVKLVKLQSKISHDRTFGTPYLQCICRT